jgi:4-diphosphocytidyl-2-C-methyl-D-erythritol kinase
VGDEQAGVIQVAAHAKVNLTLEVLGKRPDGYHEIRSVMRALSLHDTLRLALDDTMSVSCSLKELSGDTNLAFRAASLLREATGFRGGVAIFINKVIPVAGGLGGGSSNAAATLTGLNALWRLDIPTNELHELAAQLGSDVPFFLYGGTALAEGRGERITPVDNLPSCTVLLVNPGIAVSTAAVYRAVTKADYTDGASSQELARLAGDTPPARWRLVNGLQRVTVQAYPAVGEILAALPDWGAAQSLMCGSGPTCFGLFTQDNAAHAAAARARARGWSAWVTHFAVEEHDLRNEEIHASRAWLWRCCFAQASSRELDAGTT